MSFGGPYSNCEIVDPYLGIFMQKWVQSLMYNDHGNRVSDNREMHELIVREVTRTGIYTFYTYLWKRLSNSKAPLCSGEGSRSS